MKDKNKKFPEFNCGNCEYVRSLINGEGTCGFNMPGHMRRRDPIVFIEENDLCSLHSELVKQWLKQ